MTHDLIYIMTPTVIASFLTMLVIHNVAYRKGIGNVERHVWAISLSFLVAMITVIVMMIKLIHEK